MHFHRAEPIALLKLAAASSWPHPSVYARNPPCSGRAMSEAPGNFLKTQWNLRLQRALWRRAQIAALLGGEGLRCSHTILQIGGILLPSGFFLTHAPKDITGWMWISWYFTIFFSQNCLEFLCGCAPRTITMVPNFNVCASRANSGSFAC